MVTFGPTPHAFCDNQKVPYRHHQVRVYYIFQIRKIEAALEYAIDELKPPKLYSAT